VLDFSYTVEKEIKKRNQKKKTKKEIKKRNQEKKKSKKEIN